ncbi:MAG TPA: zf-HC2 domain-containing protein [Bryobacteraceae bacterium]|nr:zf-HC2 domain-containing protein [Bryobacteraceae bacterium]
MTCADLEITLCDYLDGTLAPAARAEVERHLSECATCAELARDAGAALAFMERVADIEPPPELVTRMFAIPGMPGARATVRVGIRKWFHNLVQPVLQPRMAFGLSLTILFFGMMARCAGIQDRHLSASDLDPARVWTGVDNSVHRGWERTVKFYENLRFVYQIQSKLREWREQQEQEPAGAAAENADERRLPVKNTPAQSDAGQPGAAAPKK